MATLRCPQCGAVNRDDAVDFPLCRQCHERLVQCGYCRQFQRDDPDGAGTCGSKAAGGPRPARADDAPDCPHFQSRYLAKAPGSRVPIHPAAWILGLIALVFVVLFALSTMVRPAGPAGVPVRLEAQTSAEGEPALVPVLPGEDRAAHLRVELEAPYPVQAGDEFAVLLTARNVSSRPTGEIRLGIPVTFLEAFRLRGLEPDPAARLVREGRRWFRYPSLDPGEWLRVKIRLSARAAGAYEFQARLEAPNLELPDEIPAPLQVLPGPAPGGAENGNGDST